jgi:hypothetical protein
MANRVEVEDWESEKIKSPAMDDDSSKTVQELTKQVSLSLCKSLIINRG